jgi:hypothetical protein
VFSNLETRIAQSLPSRRKKSFRFFLKSHLLVCVQVAAQRAQKSSAAVLTLPERRVYELCRDKRPFGQPDQSRAGFSMNASVFLAVVAASADARRILETVSGRLNAAVRGGRRDHVRRRTLAEETVSWFLLIGSTEVRNNISQHESGMWFRGRSSMRLARSGTSVGALDKLSSALVRRRTLRIQQLALQRGERMTFADASPYPQWCRVPPA